MVACVRGVEDQAVTPVHACQHANLSSIALPPRTHRHCLALQVLAVTVPTLTGVVDAKGVAAEQACRAAERGWVTGLRSSAALANHNAAESQPVGDRQHN